MSHWIFLSGVASRQGVYYQIGDVIKVTDEEDGKAYYAQIRGFVQDQYCEKSAALTWLIPTQASPKDHFDAGTYILGEPATLPSSNSNVFVAYSFITVIILRTIIMSVCFCFEVRKRTCPGKWSTWTLCVMRRQSTSSRGARRSPPSPYVRRKVTSGRTLDPHLLLPSKSAYSAAPLSTNRDFDLFVQFLVCDNYVDMCKKIIIKKERERVTDWDHQFAQKKGVLFYPATKHTACFLERHQKCVYPTFFMSGLGERA